MTTAPPIKYADKTMLAAIAHCHIQAFPRSLSSQMGKKYVEKMLDWYLSSSKNFLFYVEDNGQCVGYCGGYIHDGSQETGSASGMLQHSFDDAVKAIIFRPWLLFHPELRAKYRFALRNIRSRLRKKFFPRLKANRAPRPISTEPYAGLVVIGAIPAVQGKGFGSLLLHQFERIAAERGIRQLLLTVMANNAQAIRSYQRNGWVATQDKGQSLQMTKEISLP